MHCGNLFLLLLGLWVELTAGRVIRDTSAQLEMQSIIEDLQVALQDYRSVLKNTSFLKGLPVLPCTETTSPRGQSSTLVQRLSNYQACAERLGSLCPDVSALCRVVMLNQDLLQHLNGSHQDAAGCPTSTLSPPPPDFHSTSESIQCVSCWSEEVEALRR